MGMFDKVLDVLGFKSQDQDDSYYEEDGQGLSWQSDQESDDIPLYVEDRSERTRPLSGVRHMVTGSQSVHDDKMEEDMRIVLVQPIRFEEAQNIAHNLLNGKAVIFDLQECDVDEAINIVNFVSGAVYALDGSIQKINERGAIFLAVPPTVELENEMVELFSEESYGPTIAEWVNRSRSVEDF